ncbi:Polyhydroxyalkanoic acid synthase [Minicystis rosea]|nr:Polyhydroxyalkanoic acid synthase [Minicystis rosea]
MKTIEHLVPNGDGWLLSLYQTWDEERFVPGRRPILIVPGYGMNSFIFSYHPRGLSLEGYLAEAGFEVWRVDLRAQGGSRSIGGGDDFLLQDLALTDLKVALRAALERSRTGASRADLIGASLGGTIMFIHAVLERDAPLGSLVAIGSPVRWLDVHPAIKIAFSWPTLVGLVRLKGTRKLAGLALPQLAKRLPSVLSIYMNAEITDTSAAAEMVKTVEDPNRHVNRQIACWIRDRDLVLRGVNVSEGLTRLANPLLCVSALGDGIVPRRTAEFPYLAAGTTDKQLIEVGTKEIVMAHADLFISSESQARVFEPLATWLRAHD